MLCGPDPTPTVRRIDRVVTVYDYAVRDAAAVDLPAIGRLELRA